MRKPFTFLALAVIALTAVASFSRLGNAAPTPRGWTQVLQIQAVGSPAVSSYKSANLQLGRFDEKKGFAQVGICEDGFKRCTNFKVEDIRKGIKPILNTNYLILTAPGFEDRSNRRWQGVSDLTIDFKSIDGHRRLNVNAIAEKGMDWSSSRPPYRFETDEKFGRISFDTIVIDFKFNALRGVEQVLLKSKGKVVKVINPENLIAVQ